LYISLVFELFGEFVAFGYDVYIHNDCFNQFNNIQIAANRANIANKVNRANKVNIANKMQELPIHSSEFLSVP